MFDFTGNSSKQKATDMQLRQLQTRQDNARFQTLIPDIIPAKLTSYTSGRYAWTEQWFDTLGDRVDKAGGKTGLATWLPAKSATTTVLTTFPIPVWLIRTIQSDTLGVVYEVLEFGLTGQEEVELDYVSKICFTRNSGVLTGATVEHKTIRIMGVPLSAETYCTASDEDCCPTVTVACCVEPIPTTLCFTISTTNPDYDGVKIRMTYYSSNPDFPGVDGLLYNAGYPSSNGPCWIGDVPRLSDSSGYNVRVVLTCGPGGNGWLVGFTGTANPTYNPLLLGDYNGSFTAEDCVAVGCVIDVACDPFEVTGEIGRTGLPIWGSWPDVLYIPFNASTQFTIVEWTEDCVSPYPDPPVDSFCESCVTCPDVFSWDVEDDPYPMTCIVNPSSYNPSADCVYGQFGESYFGWILWHNSSSDEWTLLLVFSAVTYTMAGASFSCSGPNTFTGSGLPDMTITVTV